MRYPFVSYEGASNCTDGPAPGTSALLAWLLANRNGRSMGVFNCRTVRGGSTTSLHGEGRAVDWGVAVGSDGRGTPAGHELVNELGEAAAELGIQVIIYDRTIWSARSPGGREYTGVHPHYDHLHVEQNQESSRTLTLAKIAEILGGSTSRPESPREPSAPAPAPTPSGWAENLRGTVRGLPTIRRGDKTVHSAIVQALYVAEGHSTMQRMGGIVHSFGPVTERTTRLYQRSNSIRVDGIVGPQTRGRLLTAAKTPVVRQDARGRPVRRTQALLHAHGHREVGAVDGVFGPKTEGAVEAFQRAKRFTVDGVVGPQTWTGLIGG